MDLSPAQHARMAVLDHLLHEMSDGSIDSTVNIKIEIISLTHNGSDWRAVVSTNAHTDRNYSVSYMANPGQTLVETFVKSSEVRYWDKPKEASPAPTKDYYGA